MQNFSESGEENGNGNREWEEEEEEDEEKERDRWAITSRLCEVVIPAISSVPP